MSSVGGREDSGLNAVPRDASRVYITTYSGVQFDLLHPTPDMVKIGDIIHHLSQVCRWAGACKQFWSVAQHSVLTSYIVPPHLRQWALMHDAAEAYIGDITRPLKTLLPGVRHIEERVMQAICEHFVLPFPEPVDLSFYDDQVQRFEAENIMPRHDGRFMSRGGASCDIASFTGQQLREIPHTLFRPMDSSTVEIVFAFRFRDLFGSSEKYTNEL